MSNLDGAILSVALCGALALGALSAPRASAAGAPFTWNPQWTAPFAGNANVDGQFTADNIIASNYDGIQINIGTGAFTESGILTAAQFFSNNLPVSLPKLNNGYAIYMAYTATGIQTPGVLTPGTGLFGSFNTLHFDMYEALGSPMLSATATGGQIGNLTNAIRLAGGDLVSSGSSTLFEAANGDVTATASVKTTFVPDPAAAGFFVSPGVIDFSFQAMSATASELSQCGLQGGFIDLCIAGGGANITFLSPKEVPEPASVGLLAAALLGLAGVLQRRKSTRD